MVKPLKGGMVAGLVVFIGIATSLAVRPSAGQGSNMAMRRASDGKPDLSGIWQALSTADWDLQAHAARPGRPDLGALGAVPPGLSVVEGNEIPYQPAAAAER